jgi:hypothetical protein
MDTWQDNRLPTLEMLNYWSWIGADNLYWSDRDFEDLESGA